MEDILFPEVENLLVAIIGKCLGPQSVSFIERFFSYMYLIEWVTSLSL